MRFITAIFNRLFASNSQAPVSQVPAMITAIITLQKAVGADLGDAVRRTIPAALMPMHVVYTDTGHCVNATPNRDNYGRTMQLRIHCPNAQDCAAMEAELQTFPWLVHDGTMLVHDNTIYCNIYSGYGELVDAYLHMRAILGIPNL
jgi:hypothetical protein